ncbi:MAG: hypothetical protein ACQKBY_03045 [Verrucomicrobiales bacterium]
MKNQISPQRHAGFALIVTVTLLLLMAVLVIGFLSLATTTARVAQHDEARATAQANARLALLLALGELQKNAGADTRVTARADILDEENAPVLGVWKSWEGTDHEASGEFAGRPVAPDYGAKTRPVSSGGRFLKWLVSGPATGLSQPDAVPDTSAAPAKVTLVGEKTLGAGRTESEIHLAPVSVAESGRAGSYAWWIGGENLKARLPEIEKSDSYNEARWAAKQKSHGTADPAPFGLEALLSEPAAAGKAISLEQADLLENSGAEPLSQAHFYDLSTVSTGLLTNTATGGWRKDLSLFTERYDDLPAGALPLFRLTPEEDRLVEVPRDSAAANYNSDGFSLYPWASYRGDASRPSGDQQAAVASWRNLADFATYYRNDSPEARALPNDFGVGATAFYEHLHKVRLHPVVARVHWVFSYYSVTRGTQYRPCLLVTPVVTLWNPYNVTLKNINPFRLIMGTGGNSNGDNANINSPLPCVFEYKVGERTSGYRGLLKGYSSYGEMFMSDSQTMSYRIQEVDDMPPGSTAVYAPTANKYATDREDILDLSRGYHGLFGQYFYMKSGHDRASSYNIVAPGNDRIEITNIIFDNEIDSEGSGVGVRMTMRDQSLSGKPRIAFYNMTYPKEVAEELYPLISGNQINDSGPLSSLSVPEPFFAAMFGMRMASNTNIPAKGFLQTSPMVSYTSSDSGHDYKGTKHPVNMPFDFSFMLPSNGPGGSTEPQEMDGEGFIISGFSAGGGLSRCIAAELPRQPLASLAELQHWDLRYENPLPPFAFNLIGNSDATPLIPPDAVTSGADHTRENLQHDDAYCANHLLFDDWFFSSLSTGGSGSFGENGTLREAFEAFAEGSESLINSAYQARFGLSQEADPFETYAGGGDAWRSLAAAIEVRGMFNVNSTSVAAWRALLGHARNQKIPYHGDGGGVELSDEQDHALNRLSIAGDVEAGEFGFSGGPDASQFTGYRILDDSLIDDLAEKIVAQVRQRGPFLSLSEFVNRQLVGDAGDDSLAMAGAIQAALNELEDEGKIYDELKAAISSTNATAGATPPGGGDAEYAYPRAAVGSSVYGITGWPRQADLLRPLAPVLSARDDTFTIRAYGDARDSADNILATAVCEAVVSRSHHYLDASDSSTQADPPARAINQTMGRRFKLVSLRWLSADEL